MALQEFAAANINMGAEPDRKRNKKTDSTTTLESADQRIMLSPASADFSTAEKWMREGAASGWDGVVPSALIANTCPASEQEWSRSSAFAPRTAWSAAFAGRAVRKHQREKPKSPSRNTQLKRPTEEVGSLLLGLYNKNGELDHIGFSSSFTREERKN